jgi:hypothetical protein
MKATLKSLQSDTHSINVHARVGRGRSLVCDDIPQAR